MKYLEEIEYSIVYVLHMQTHNHQPHDTFRGNCYCNQFSFKCFSSESSYVIERELLAVLFFVLRERSMFRLSLPHHRMRSIHYQSYVLFDIKAKWKFCQQMNTIIWTRVCRFERRRRMRRKPNRKKPFARIWFNFHNIIERIVSKTKANNYKPNGFSFECFLHNHHVYQIHTEAMA